MDTVQRIDDIIEEKSLLKHKFYQMWSDGKLDKQMLAGYSKEYYQLVKCIPEYMESVMAGDRDNTILEHNLQEEYDHIPLWEDFAESLGVDRAQLESYSGLPETRQAIQNMRDIMCGDYTGAVAMYALEKEIPKISHTKMEGLEKFYGIDEESSIKYFVEHSEADVRHAAAWRDTIKSAATNDDNAIQAAHASMDAQNLLLDGCYRAYCVNEA